MNEPTTSIGKEMAADDRQHGSACEVRRADWCRCGQVENIVMVERQAAQQERERLRQFHKRDPHHDTRFCRWCERLADPEDDR